MARRNDIEKALKSGILALLSARALSYYVNWLNRVRNRLDDVRWCRNLIRGKSRKLCGTRCIEYLTLVIEWKIEFLCFLVGRGGCWRRNRKKKEERKFESSLDNFYCTMKSNRKKLEMFCQKLFKNNRRIILKGSRLWNLCFFSQHITSMLFKSLVLFSKTKQNSIWLRNSILKDEGAREPFHVILKLLPRNFLVVFHSSLTKWNPIRFNLKTISICTVNFSPSHMVSFFFFS